MRQEFLMHLSPFAGGQFKSERLLRNIKCGTSNPSADNSFADDPSSP